MEVLAICVPVFRACLSMTAWLPMHVDILSLFMVRFLFSFATFPLSFSARMTYHIHTFCLYHLPLRPPRLLFFPMILFGKFLRDLSFACIATSIGLLPHAHAAVLRAGV